MAKATRKPAGKSTQPIIVQNINIRPINRTDQTVGKWRTAIRAAESTTNPNRQLLYDLYFDLQLDAQLINTTNARRRKVTNSKLTFTSDGKVNEVMQHLIESPVFFKLLIDIIDARFWGFSVMEFYLTNGELHYDLIPRRHVKPEMNIVVSNPGDTNGTDYTETPVSNYIVTAGNQKDLGLYMPVTQYVLYKRGCFGDWAQFSELFGMPFRFGKYDGYDENTRAKLEQALEKMGSAAYAVFPENASIEVVQNNNNGNGEVYERLKNASDEQISLIMLGQTMTTKDGSSLSQAKVHADVAEDVHIDDRRFVTNVLNNEFVKILTTFGLPTNGKFEFVDESKLSLTDRINIDDKISRHIILPDDYWFERYGIDKPENYDALKKEAEAKAEAKLQAEIAAKQPAPPISKPPERKPIRASYNPPAVQREFWAGFNPFAAASGAMSKKDLKALDKEAKRIAALIYSGNLPNDYFVSENMVALISGHLKIAVETGYGSATSFAAGSADAATVEALTKNVYQFSAAKNYNMLQDMNGLLIAPDGTSRSLNDFNKAVEKLNIDYNRNWQQSEYNTAQASSQMASKYNQYTAEADALPMLTFVTAGDEFVRKSHRRLDGMIAPVNDPVWQKYWPPLDWGCRCDVIQLESDEIKRTVPKADNMPEIGKGFEKNPAKGEIFSRKHPYFKGVPKDVAKKIWK